LSLPLAFGTRPETIPPPIVPRSDPTRLAVWCERLGEKSRPRIGLAWSGNPGNRNDRNRSLALAELAPLLSQDFEWISLQKDVRADDGSVLTAYPGIRHFGAGFADTAALIELTDLVIAVDTSIAHLAGTMGKRVWILLAFNADWRWPKDGDDSPWYPTARLFRQPALGDWASVVERLRGELAALA
jgi:ADP-heptose:LPS heptosyltransferase